MGAAFDRYTTTRHAWLARLDADGSASRPRGRLGRDCMVLGWTEWADDSGGATAKERLTDAGRVKLAEWNAAFGAAGHAPAPEETIRAVYERNYAGGNQTALSWSAFRGGWRACEHRAAAGAPDEPPASPFAVGETVHVIDRNGVALSTRTVTKASARHVTTDCGRHWTQQGEWFDGARSWPFPTIAKVAPSGVETDRGGER